MPHHPLRELRQPNGKPWGVDSQTLLAVAPTKQTACLFIHGWLGDALETWGHLPLRLRDLSEADGCDFFFYGYKANSQTVAFSAGQLRKFLDPLLRSPRLEVVQSSLQAPRPGVERYARLRICCHSLGAVVARRALLDLERENPAALDSCEVRFLMFAPAHCGAVAAEFADKAVGANFALQVVGATAEFLTQPSMRDLRPGSDTLVLLQRDNESRRKQRIDAKQPADYLRAKVFHADKDRVVVQNDFDDDWPLEPIEGEDHRSICKPRPDYDRPIAALKAML